MADDAQAAEPPADPSRRRQSFGKAVAEVLLIALGVFLGLAGEQWRADATRREQTTAALQRFRGEIAANQKAVAAVKDYHAELKQRLRDYFRAEPSMRKVNPVRVEGIQPAGFEHTAWDLAIATQSLADIDQDLAFNLTRAYRMQEQYRDLTRGVLQAMYLRPINENPEAFLAALDTYYGDVVLIEPQLLTMYEALLTQIERALAP